MILQFKLQIHGAVDTITMNPDVQKVACCGRVITAGVTGLYLNWKRLGVS